MNLLDDLNLPDDLKRKIVQERERRMSVSFVWYSAVFDDIEICDFIEHQALACRRCFLGEYHLVYLGEL